MPAEMLDQRGVRPYKTAGTALVGVAALALGLLFGLFRGGFSDKTDLTMMSSRAGLVLEPGSKVTFNGVEIGKVENTDVVDVGGVPKAKITVEVDSKFVERIPANVEARVSATTVFGNKYVALSSPKDVAVQRITSSDVIDVTSVTTEFNSLFETVLSVSEKVDPVKLNQTLAAAGWATDSGSHSTTATRSWPTSTRRFPRSGATPSCWPTSASCTRTRHPICSTAWRTRSPPRAPSTNSGPAWIRR